MNPALSVRRALARMVAVRPRSYLVRTMSLSQITWRDVQQLPEDGHRHEAIEGELHVTAAPGFRHQRVSLRLALVLHRLLEEPGHGIIVTAPVGVEFPATGEGVQPDLVFVAADREGILRDDWIRGAPDLVVEILSPSTASRDQGVKLKLYRRQGIPEYWIVDPDAETVEAWTLEGDEPTCERHSVRVPVRLRGVTAGHVDLAEIFGRES